MVEDFRIFHPVPVAVWARSMEEALEAWLPLWNMLGACEVCSGEACVRSP